MNDDKPDPRDQSQKFVDAAREHGANEDEGSWMDRLKALVGVNRGLTGPGYWAKLRNAGIEPLYRLANSSSWMARNRSDEKFVVRDPGDMTPDERADLADYFVGLYGG
jgi:hypothetical protein